MTDVQKRKAAEAFSEYWKDKGYEKGESQPFWLSLLRDVLGVEHPEQYIKFESQTHIDRTSFIDGMIDATHVLIEQKSSGKDLRSPIRQADGSLLKPFEQARRYAIDLPYSQRPRWIVTCNFQEFLIYDMEKPSGEPESILLKDLHKEYYRLEFLVEEKSELLHREEQISLQAGEIVGKLYEALLGQYIHPDDKASLHSLNVLCVRLVFCLYAEDAGIFGEHLKFQKYLKEFAPKNVRRALIDLFSVLDTKPEDRDPYLDERLASFPYVNGGLFANQEIEIPNFTQEILDILLHKASEEFDWSQISPTIFGAVFESTLNPVTRRSGGMHYTSIENIHKVIDPLFLDDLKKELEEIRAIRVDKIRKQKAEEFRKKLSGLTFFDPACGSGNFLTESYISLRRLENEALEIIYENQIAWDVYTDVIQVSIGQFYGIEINDFAVTVAKTALWIAESQMMQETEDILKVNLDFLPLKSYANITCGNALRVDWETVVPKERLNYIMGNPPFVGARLMSGEQKDDLFSVFSTKWKNAGNLDYVSCWYKKAFDLMKGTFIRAALVSTNSVSQGECVAILWKPLFKEGVHIDFAHRTFRWDSEASIKAHVHCVIIGFSVAFSKKPKVIYSSERPQIVSNINAYLLDAPNTFIESRTTPISNVPEIGIGNKPIDDGNYLFTREEMEAFIKLEPKSSMYFRRWYGAYEFINNIERYCLWLGHCSPNELRSMPYCLDRVSKVREFRLNSKSEGTRKIADTPTRFHVENMPASEYIVLPETSSEKRKYIPFGFLDSNSLCGNSLRLMPNATLYHFGVLTSNVHMAWMRAVCGRLEMRYRYSKDIVYNNFPWPTPTTEQKAKIEQTAQAILDARALYPDCSLADLYDELAMPPELRKAHRDNDRAVMQAYGFPVRNDFTESMCVAELMQMYQRLADRKGD